MTETKHERGESSLTLGDSMKLIKRVEDESVQLLLADPPYNVTQKNNFDTMGRTGIEFAWDGDFDQLSWLDLAVPKIERGGAAVIFNDYKNIGDIAYKLIELGMEIKGDFVWSKCLEGSTWVYAKTQKAIGPMMLKDLARLDPQTIEFWGGSAWTKVVSISESLNNFERLEIELKSGELLRCTANHKWPSNRGVLFSSELKVGDSLTRCLLPQHEPKSPHGLDDELIGWFIGAYLANGSLTGHKNKPKVCISGDKKHKERWQRLSQVADDYHGTIKFYELGGNSKSAHLTGDIIRGIVSQYVKGKDCYTKHLKTLTWERSNVFLRSILLGYLEGDGHYDAPNDLFRLGFTGKNKRLVVDLRALAARLDMPLRLSKATAHFDGREFPAFRGTMRTERSTHHNARNDDEIVAIRPAKWAGKFWDVEVEDEPHLFALASGILTHNSNPMPRNTTRLPVRCREYAIWAIKPKTKSKGGWVFNFTKTKDQPYHRGEWFYPVQRALNPTKKPDGLFADIMRLLSNEGDRVLDPFGGCGTTLVAGAMTGRNTTVFEIHKPYYDDALRRWRDARVKHKV